MENMKSMLINSMGPAEDLTFDELVTANILVSDPTAIWDNLGINATDAIRKLAQRSDSLRKKQMAQSNALDVATTQAPEGGATGNQILTELPEDRAGYQDVTPKQQLADLEASATLMESITPQSMNRPGAAEQFAEGVQSVGTVLMATPQFISAKMMRRLVGGTGLSANLAALEAVNPEAATESRVMIRSGVSKQKTMLEQNLNSIEQNARGGGYPLDLVYDKQEASTTLPTRTTSVTSRRSTARTTFGQGCPNGSQLPLDSE